MDYFSYLRIMEKEDTKGNYIDFLIDIVDYSVNDAINYANFIYGNKEEKEVENEND